MIKFNNVYIKNVSLVAGPLEKNGPYKSYFDKTYEDYYMAKTVEQSEVKMQTDAIDILIRKEKIKKNDIDLFIGGDLQNQITASSYAMDKYDRPFLGIFNACATANEGLIIGSAFIDSKKVNNSVITVSSHNLAAEKQFRNPIEYGSPKKITQTFTSTGACSVLLSNTPSNIKITSATIGKVVNLKEKDVNNMGAVTAPACADTLIRHLNDSKRKLEDYDLILSGDLGIYGMNILKDYINKVHNLQLKDNYNDCGAMLYDMEKQKTITAGGSGPVCSALVNFGYVYNQLETKKIKRVLLLTTGALFSPTFAYQKQDILGICHAVEVEGL